MGHVVGCFRMHKNAESRLVQPTIWPPCDRQEGTAPTFAPVFCPPFHRQRIKHKKLHKRTPWRRRLSMQPCIQTSKAHYSGHHWGQLHCPYTSEGLGCMVKQRNPIPSGHSRYTQKTARSLLQPHHQKLRFQGRMATTTPTESCHTGKRCLDGWIKSCHTGA